MISASSCVIFNERNLWSELTFGFILFRYGFALVCLFLAPQLCHVFKCFSLGLRNESPDKDGGNDADDSVKSVCKPVPEVISLCKMHVEHRHERRTDYPVEYPLERYGYRHGLATDCIWENLCNQHPADWPPGHHEGCTIEHDTEHGYRMYRRISKCKGYSESTDSHSYGTYDEQRFASYSFYSEYSYQCK